VGISLNSKLAARSTYTAYGDGSVLYSTVNSVYMMWNNEYNDREGNSYAGSRIRATLVGKDDYTNTGDDYAGSDALTASESLYSCLDSELQGVIAAKEVATVKGTSSSYSTISTSDKLWFFSAAEMCGNNLSSDYLEGLADSYPMAYQKFNDTESAYFVSTKSSVYHNNDSHRVAYVEAGYSNSWLLRSIITGNDVYVRYVDHDGSVYRTYSVNYVYALGFGFCVR